MAGEGNGKNGLEMVKKAAALTATIVACTLAVVGYAQGVKKEAKAEAIVAADAGAKRADEVGFALERHIRESDAQHKAILRLFERQESATERTNAAVHELAIDVRESFRASRADRDSGRLSRPPATIVPKAPPITVVGPDGGP